MRAWRAAAAGAPRRRDRLGRRRVHADAVDFDDQFPDLCRGRIPLRVDAGHRRRRAAFRAGDGICRRVPACRARGATQDRRRTARRVIAAAASDRDTSMGPISLFAIAVLIWGSTWLAITFQLGVVAAEASVVYRFALAALMLAAWCLASGRSLRFAAVQHAWFAAQGALLFGLNYLCV